MKGIFVLSLMLELLPASQSDKADYLSASLCSVARLSSHFIYLERKGGGGGWGGNPAESAFKFDG